MLSSDYAELHMLGGPWDSGILTLGKEFNAPDTIYCRPLLTIDSEGLMLYYVHSGLLANAPDDRTSAYSLAVSSEPEIDEKGNVRIRFYYLYDKVTKWRTRFDT